MQIAIVGLLILINGVLSMSEFAIVSSERARLRKRADEGSRGAEIAIGLFDRSNRFLSTVQIGITLVGILAGAFGGAAIADSLAARLVQFDAIDENAQSIALIIVVTLTTYVTLVIGELVPKQLAIRDPEAIASWISGPMRALSVLTLPVVIFLSASSQAVLWLLGQAADKEERVTEEEVKLLLKRGERSGVFRAAERRMVAGVFRLDDIRADAVMTPRVDIQWLDADADRRQVLEVLDHTRHSRYPVCEGSVDRVIGIVGARDVAVALLRDEEPDLRRLATEAEFVPESADAGVLVQRVAETGRHFLVVVSEHGGVDGIVTAHDLAEAVLGDLGTPEARMITPGVWEISGAMPIEEVEAVLETDGMAAKSAKSYGTLAGFVMNRLGAVPRGGESFEWQGYRFTPTMVRRNRIRTVRVAALEPRTDPKG